MQRSIAGVLMSPRSLVPASVMSIAVANIYTRNRTDCGGGERNAGNQGESIEPKRVRRSSRRTV
jgi:hypothetical protein